MRASKFKVFSYYEKYDENEYLNYLKEAKFGLWLGGHESQGFALQEALSTNVPLLVWSVSYMGQEYGSFYGAIPATSIPYWDNRCGEFFYAYNELDAKFNTFIENINNYKPREYVLENLSTEVCQDRFIDLIKSL